MMAHNLLRFGGDWFNYGSSFDKQDNNQQQQAPQQQYNQHPHQQGGFAPQQQNGFAPQQNQNPTF